MDPDAIVVGAGPNGLFAACRLARAGLRVTVVEAADRPGGALWTDESVPGFHQDVGAAFVAFRDSPAFQALDLGARGLAWALADIESAHPAPDGTCAVVSRDLERSAASFGHPEDGRTFRSLGELQRRIDRHLMSFLGPVPQVLPALRMGPVDGLRLASMLARSPAGFAAATFRSEAARRVFPAMGLHVDVAPHDPLGMALCWMLTMRATTAGFAVPVGGARAITRALVADLEAHGGTVRTGARVDRVVVERRRASGVVLRGGERLNARCGVIADTGAPALYLALLEGGHVPGRIRRAMQRFPQGWGTFKVDFALGGPVPWVAEACRSAAVVHVGDSIADLHRFSLQVRGGGLPDRPYLVVGQQSLLDGTRAPEGGHTLYVYTHAPSTLDPGRYPGGWKHWREVLADVVQARIEELAPGFGARVVGRAVRDPGDLERTSANLVGGDLGGGSNAWYRQLLFRPVFPYFRYRTPVRGLYLGSSYAHPGAGIHGMCGWNAAGMLLADL